MEKKDLSYVDYLGYTLSFKNKLPFLTGDKEFKAIARNPA
jgi:hypothetical protein